MPLTLRDLAREVGVHPSTVSRVLNGDPSARLAESTRTRILERAAETGYRPNRLARSLKLRRTYVLGMLVPDIANPLFAAMLRAAEDEAGRAGYNVILSNTDDSPLRFEHHLLRLSDGHVDGLLIATAHRHDPKLDVLARQGLPYVLLNRRRDCDEDSFVVSDDRRGAELAVEHLVALGHRRIAHISGATTISTTAARREGFYAAMAAHGLAVPPHFMVEGGIVEEAGESAMQTLLRLPPEQRPTAVYAVNDLAALGAITVAYAQGLRVPEDISIVGHNDTPLAGRSWPGLTTVHIPLYQLGQQAVRILIDRLDRSVESGPAVIERVVLPVHLVARGSTAPVPQRGASGEPNLGRSIPLPAGERLP